MFNSEKSIKCKVISSASDYWCSISVLEVNAAVERGGDASVDGFREDVTDGLFDLSVDSCVKISIGVGEGLVFLVAWLSIELVVDLSCSSAIYWFAVAFIEVPVSIHSIVVSSSLTVDSEVILGLVAALVDFVSLVDEGTSDVPVLLLVGSHGVVGFNVGGVGSIEDVVSMDDLGWDDLFTCTNNVSARDGIS